MNQVFAGQIELPPVRRFCLNPLAQRQKPALVPVETTPLCAPLDQIQPLEFRQVRRTPEEDLFNRAVLHRTQACGRELGRSAGAAGGRTGSSHPNVRCAVAAIDLRCSRRHSGWSDGLELLR